MDNKKHIVNLESFRDMLHICPRLPGQSFVEPSFEEEIFAFLRFLGHSTTIKKLTDVNINKLYKPWRSFAAIINKCLTRKRSGYDSLDFVYQVKHKDTKRAMRCIILDSRRHQNTQQFGALLHIELTNEDIRNSNAYKEYYAVATGATPPKPKASVRKTRSSFDITLTPPIAVTDDDGEEGNDDDDDQEVEEDDEEDGGDDEQDSDEEEFIHPNLSTHDKEEPRDEESFDPIPKTPEDTNDEGNSEKNLGLNVGREEGHGEEEEKDELYRDVNINQGRGIQMTKEFNDSHVTLTPTSTSVAPLPMSAPTMTPSTIATITTTQQAPTPPTTAPSTLIQDLPNFGSLFGFDNRLRTLEANFSEFMQTNQFAEAVSAIPRIKIIKEQVKEQVKVQVSKILPKIEQTMNEQLEAEFLTRSSHSSKTSYDVADDLSEMELKKIIIEKMEGNKDVAMMMLIRTKNPPLDQTGGPRDAEKERRLSQQALQKRKQPGALASQHKGLNLDRHRKASAEDQPIVQTSQHPKWFSQQQKPQTLDHDWNKTLPATHRSIQPWISELEKQSDSRFSFNELIDTPLDFSNFLINRLKVDTLTPKLLAGPTYELMKGSCKSLIELEYHLEEVYNATIDQLDWVNPEGQQYPHNLLKPLPLIPNNRGHRVIPFDHFINNDLEYLRGGASSRKYTTSVTKTKAADYGHIK
nr:hypothetical protein [Tanacetum cinerariifolium]